jgi:hypothetical protein
MKWKAFVESLNGCISGVEMHLTKGALSNYTLIVLLGKEMQGLLGSRLFGSFGGEALF